MIVCTSCGEEKIVAEFFAVRTKGRLVNGKLYNTQCRSCLRRKNTTVQAEKRAWLASYKLERGCADCGYREHHSALDFDHRPDEVKVFGVKNGIATRGWKRLRAEVEKCDVVCANCHRIRTYERSKEVRDRELLLS